MTLTEAGPAPTPPEEEPQLPPPEGVEIIGWIDPAILSTVDTRKAFLEDDKTDTASYIPRAPIGPFDEGESLDAEIDHDDPLPEWTKPLASVLDLKLAMYRDRTETFGIFFERQPYNEDSEDPFGAEKNNFTSPGTIYSDDGLAHHDPEDTMIVSDSFTTICYPTRPDGQPDIENPWQPKPGQVIRFARGVWHSPHHEAQGEGVRNALIIAIPNE